MTGQDLKNSILQLAVQGNLVEQRKDEGTAEELYQRIQEEKQKLIKDGKAKKEKLLPEIAEDEIPFDIPESWKWIRLGNVIDIVSGNGLTKEYMSNHGNIPVYGGNGITGYHDKPNVFKKTLVIGRVGFYCGSVHITEGNAWITDNAFIVSFPEKYISIKYLYYLIEHIDLRKCYSSTAQPVISGKIVYPALCPLPPIDEQKRIVEKIEELLPMVEQYDKAYTKLETFNKRFPVDMQKSILQYAVQGKLLEQRPEEGNAEELYKQIQAEKEKLIKEGKIKKEKPLAEITEDEIPFDIPESWKWVRLGNIISLTSGQDLTPDKYNSINKGIPYLTGASNIENEKVIINRWTEFPKAFAYQGDLLITCKGTVGTTCILKEREVHVARQFMALTSIGVNKEYLKCFIDSYVDKLKAQAKSMIPGIDRNVILQAAFPLPPLAEQKRIVAKIEELMPMCNQLIK